MSTVVLGISASAAAHKAVDLASKLVQEGHDVHAVLTRNAARLVGPPLLRAVTGNACGVDEFDADAAAPMDHIDLGGSADLLVYAPATADLIGRMAAGIANDLPTTVALASEAPRLMAPAMNPAMWRHPLVARNVGTLREVGWQVIEPAEGFLACRDEGQGRMAEPSEIVEAVLAALAG